MSDREVRVFGVRHHGPGSARALRRAFDAWQPDVVLVEGPPEGDDVLSMVGDETMRPPVALLVYDPDRPRDAAFYPFTDHSPEWQALRWAAAHEVPARFIDLPVAVGFRARRDAEEAAAEEPDTDADDDADDTEDDDAAAPPGPTAPGFALPPEDPIATLARAAGFDDTEEWWDQVVERRVDDTDLFPALLETMEALRDARPDADTPARQREDRREAHMRRAIRAARNDGHQRIAVVCGAWHAPVLTWDYCKRRGRASADNDLLKGLRRTKVVATWVPWTHARLAFRSGYGAGVTSPGWYRVLWDHPATATERWLASTAALLREAGRDVSSAHVIEGVRLADALAALRDLPRPGLPELREATTTVLLQGDAAPLALVREALEVGDALGAVPDSTPTVPLEQDLDKRCRALRLKRTAEEKDLDLDLRTDGGRGRSHLLWRLRTIGIPWGLPLDDASSSRQGSFHEHWRIRWDPGYAVAVIEASTLGNTVRLAAVTALAERGEAADSLPALVQLLDASIRADLPDARQRLLQTLADRAAVAPDIHRLVEALPELGRIARYGDVRGTDVTDVLPILEGLLERVFLGLPLASQGIDDDAAAALTDGMAAIQRILLLLERADLATDWDACLAALADNPSVHARVRGSATRLRLDAGSLGEESLALLVGHALGLGTEPARAAAWLEGFLAAGGLALLYRDAFWTAFDAWLAHLHDDVFVDLLPALRRGFSGFTRPERRKVGERIAALRGGGSTTKARAATPLDPARAARVLPVLATLLGVPTPEASP